MRLQEACDQAIEVVTEGTNCEQATQVVTECTKGGQATEVVPEYTTGDQVTMYSPVSYHRSFKVHDIPYLVNPSDRRRFGG